MKINCCSWIFILYISTVIFAYNYISNNCIRCEYYNDINHTVSRELEACNLHNNFKISLWHNVCGRNRFECWRVRVVTDRKEINEIFPSECFTNDIYERLKVGKVDTYGNFDSILASICVISIFFGFGFLFIFIFINENRNPNIYKYRNIWWKHPLCYFPLYVWFSKKLTRRTFYTCECYNY